MLSLGGLPPTGGFFAKFYLFRAVLERSDFWSVFLVVIAVANSAIAIYYYLRVVTAMYFREVGREPKPLKSVPMSAALTIACLATLVLGLMPGWLFSAVQSAVFGPLGK
jgi:NADH-quinone oxidoreductase subunit N